jgi:hypothetical protein
MQGISRADLMVIVGAYSRGELGHGGKIASGGTLRQWAQKRHSSFLAREMAQERIESTKKKFKTVDKSDVSKQRVAAKAAAWGSNEASGGD